MTSITDEEMNALLRTAKSYSVVILKPGPRRHQEGPRRSFGSTGGGISRFGPMACSPLFARSDPKTSPVFTFSTWELRRPCES